MRIATIGHCQAEALASILVKLCDVESADFIHISKLETIEAKKTLAAADITFILSSFYQKALNKINVPELKIENVKPAPTIFFNGFHPDFDYVPGLTSAIGNPVSTILTAGFLLDVPRDKVVKLFNSDVYERLGYFDYFDIAKSALLKDCESCGLDASREFERWALSGRFVYTPNHPSRDVQIGVASLLADAHGIETRTSFEAKTIKDRRHGVSWPVYPEIAERLGVSGDMLFHRKKEPTEPLDGKNIFTIEEFAEFFYEKNRFIDREKTLQRNYISLEKLNVIRDASLASKKRPGLKSSPFVGLPAHRFWRRAVAGVAADAVNPMLKAKFSIDRSTKIATAGSCFAQHLARHLVRRNYNYLVVEDGRHLEAPEREARNFGTYSARYGNVYTVRQLDQLFDRSENRRHPIDSVWERGGRYFDPFRPEIEPDGFQTAQALQDSREEHLAYVSRMWRELEVFVFTLGLTEAWLSKRDGSIFPVAPGVVSDSLDPANYEFHNFSAREIEDDLQSFVSKLRSVNPAAKILLTVSPVPLVATYADRHVLVSTTYSKAALRVAAEEVSKSDPSIEYFPSYEIITGAFNRGRYFEEDLRTVTETGVSHVMRSFLESFTGERSEVPPDDGSSSAPPTEAHNDSERNAQAVSAIERGRLLICEEELNDA